MVSASHRAMSQWPRLSRHMPLDVIGGAGLGILFGEIGRWIEVFLRRSEPRLTG